MPPLRVNNRRLYQRMAFIWGVKKSEVKPRVVTGSTGIFTRGEYDPNTHHVTVNPHFKGSFRSTLAHELRHGIQRILLPRRTITDDYSTRYFVEITNLTEREALREYMRASGDATEDPALLISNTIIGIPIGIGLMIREYRRQRYFHSFLNRHREDGLLLMWAHPPVSRKGILTTNFQQWEQRMVQKGFLHATGGLTERGLRFLRQRITREKILSRVRKLEAARKKK